MVCWTEKRHTHPTRMSTETLPLPPTTAGLCHRGQESSEADAFRDMMESRDMAKNVPVTSIAPDDSLAPLLDRAISSLAKDSVLEAPSSSEQKGGHFGKDSPATAMLSEGIKVVDVSDQANQGQAGGPPVLQNKMPDPSSDSQLKGDKTSSLLAQGEEGSHLECHGEIPDAFSEHPSPAGTSARLVQGEEGRHDDHCHEKDPVVPMDSLKQLELGQEVEGSPLAHDGGAADISSERQKSTTSISSQLDLSGESGVGDSHGQPPGLCPGSPGQPELADNPEPALCSRENSQASCAGVVSPDSPGTSLVGTTSPKRQPWEGGCLVPPSHPPSSAASAEPSHAAKMDEGIQPGCQEITGSGEEEEEERTSSGQGQASLASEEYLGNLNGQVPREGLVHNPQATEEQLARDTTCSPAASSLALADTSCRQRAAISESDTASREPAAVPAPSPVATSDTDGPAHQGLAAACDGLAIHESSGSGSDNSRLQGEAGAQAELESARGGEEAAGGDAEPEETARHPEGAKDPAAAQDRAEELPGLERPTGTKEPAGTMVLASAEDPHGARDRADSQDLASSAYPVAASEHAGSDPNPSEGLLLDVGDPAANTEDLASAADPACAVPDSDEPSVTSGAGWPTDWTGNAPDHPETPIEREIRLHLEREELLRRERGLASPRGTQEYVEVRIRPILNQSMASSTLPKEKERQRAGAQMQREIQRECRREEDLVQLGKVRGAYDRGTPQELQEKKLIFEQHPSPESLASRKMVSSSGSSSVEGMRGPSFAEANCAANVVILDSRPLLRSPWLPPERASSPNPFFCLRAKSPQSLLEQEVQEAQERERELQRQRYNLYGSVLPCHPAETSLQEEEEEMPTQPERPFCKKLDVTWPPPSPSETSQPERSPRIFRRQRSALIQRWESGAVGNQDSQD